MRAPTRQKIPEMSTRCSRAPPGLPSQLPYTAVVVVATAALRLAIIPSERRGVSSPYSTSGQRRKVASRGWQIITLLSSWIRGIALDPRRVGSNPACCPLVVFFCHVLFCGPWEREIFSPWPDIPVAASISCVSRPHFYRISLPA